MKQFLKCILLISVFSSLLVLSGCPKKVTPPPVPSETKSEPITAPEPSIVDKEYRSRPELKNINFDYDSFVIKENAKKILEANADFLKNNPDLEVLVEGHCCECGTNEYNLALGQKRAQAVRDYYIKLGVSAGRIGTISYGEEQPININAGPPDSPRCIDNRRAETKVRVKSQ